ARGPGALEQRRLARRVRRAVRAIPFLGARGGRCRPVRRARHAGPRVRGRDGPRRATRQRQLLHACIPGARDRARRSGRDPRPPLRSRPNGRGALAAPRRPARCAARSPPGRRVLPGRRLGGVSAPRTARALGGATATIAPSRDVERLTSARRALFSLAGPAKQQALGELAGAEAALARRLFTAAVASLERRAAELVAAGKDRDLFGRRRGLRPDERALLRRVRASRRELRMAARRLSREGGAPFFAFESHFADILRRGGFDLVAGSPPWVRGERVPAQVRETVATRYATWRPAHGPGFAHLT